MPGEFGTERTGRAVLETQTAPAPAEAIGVLTIGVQVRQLTSSCDVLGPGNLDSESCSPYNGDTTAYRGLLTKKDLSRGQTKPEPYAIRPNDAFLYGNRTSTASPSWCSRLTQIASHLSV